ncbi:MAG TPA: RNA polymerase sigma-70 factor [Prolixibacteraceae bacterium]|nr:RNA polymerase sigma-70 factor [Prolixibacteraceae bacterium]
MSINKHDQILIEGLKQGNRIIYDYLFHLYYSGLVVYVKSIIENSQAAEDIVQDFFISIWVNREKLSISKSIKSYFFTSVRNRSIDLIRQQKTKPEKTPIFPEELPDSDNSYNYLIESELRTMIDSAISKLPPVCRDIFVLNRFEGIKPSEIAVQKGISVRTVETHIGKALKIMKQELEKYMPLSVAMLILNQLAAH